jgi:hypothetical protein
VLGLERLILGDHRRCAAGRSSARGHAAGPLEALDVTS